MYMKAAVIYEAGGPQQLKIRQVPVPSLKEGWSLIKIKGFGLNHSEIFTRKGLSPTVSFAPLTAAMLNTHYSPINKFTLFPAICPGLIWQPFPNPAIQPLAP